MVFKRVVGGDTGEATVQLGGAGVTIEPQDLKGHFQPK